MCKLLTLSDFVLEPAEVLDIDIPNTREPLRRADDEIAELNVACVTLQPDVSSDLRWVLAGIAYFVTSLLLSVTLMFVPVASISNVFHCPAGLDSRLVEGCRP